MSLEGEFGFRSGLVSRVAARPGICHASLTRWLDRMTSFHNLEHHLFPTLEAHPESTVLRSPLAQLTGPFRRRLRVGQSGLPTLSACGCQSVLCFRLCGHHQHRAGRSFDDAPNRVPGE